MDATQSQVHTGMPGNLMHIAEGAQLVVDLVPFYCLKYKQQGPTV